MAPRTARARTTDPETSHDVTRSWSTEKLRASQARVLNMFMLYGEMHDKALLLYLNDMEKAAGLDPMSPSGVRSRRSELSKPNMARLDELVRELWKQAGVVPETKTGRDAGFTDATKATQDRARDLLRGEGFRSKLWDTGRRELVDGHNVIVWGVAK